MKRKTQPTRRTFIWRGFTLPSHHPAVQMNANFLSRRTRHQTQAMLAAALLGSFSGCTTLRESVQPTGGAPASGTSEPMAGAAPSGSALDAQLAGLNRQIEGRQEYNTRLRELVATKEQQLASVLALDRSAGPAVQEFDLRTSVNSEIGKVDRAAKAWQATIDAHQAVLKGASTDPRGPELEAEINRLAEERAELLRQRARLLAINEKLRR